MPGVLGSHIVHLVNDMRLSVESLRATTASLGEALRNMQRAWINYRDAGCLYEQAQWFGGTGGGPATMACHMHETARQTLVLEGWWSQ